MVVELPNGKNFYMDQHLSSELDTIKSRVLKDDDRVFIVDGGERQGKSVLAMQLAAKVDPTFNLSRVCLSAEEFVDAIKAAKKYQAVVFDEAFTGLSSRTSLSRVNNLIVTLMMEMGQKNLFVFIVMPSIFFLERYVVLFRANGLFHVYTTKGKRGRWLFFNKSKLKYLYLFGKKFFSYNAKGVPTSAFRGRFFDQYVVDEKAYRLKKRKSLESKTLKLRTNKVDYDSRNRLLWALKKELGISIRDLENLIAGYGIRLSRNAISQGVNKVSDDKQ